MNVINISVGIVVVFVEIGTSVVFDSVTPLTPQLVDPTPEPLDPYTLTDPYIFLLSNISLDPHTLIYLMYRYT